MIHRALLAANDQARQCLVCGEPMDVIAFDTVTKHMTAEPCGHDVTDQMMALLP